MQWKVLEFYRKLNDNNEKTFGFKSTKFPPRILSDLSDTKKLSEFESELALKINNIEYRNISNGIQKKVNNDINEIKTCNKILVSADKSGNLYKLDKDQYEKLLKENISKTYKKSTNKKIEKTNNIAKQITEKLSKADRVPMLEETKAYISIKDHKREFANKILCGLLNPSKSRIGKISKVI